MGSRHGVRTHAHRAGREDVRLSFWQPAGGTRAPPPMGRLAPGRRGGGGERRFRGEGPGLFGVGSVLWRGGDARGRNAAGMEEILMNGHLPWLYFRSHRRRRSQRAKPTVPSPCAHTSALANPAGTIHITLNHDSPSRGWNAWGLHSVQLHKQNSRNVVPACDR